MLTVFSYIIYILLSFYQSIVLEIQFECLNQMSYIPVQTPLLELDISYNSSSLEIISINDYSYSNLNISGYLNGHTYTFTLKPINKTRRYYGFIKGYVIYDGYKFNIKENSDFFSPSMTPSTDYPGYYMVIGSSDKANFSFTINDNSIPTQSFDEYIPRFICNDIHYTFNYDSNFPIGIKFDTELKNKNDFDNYYTYMIFYFDFKNNGTLIYNSTDIPVENEICYDYYSRIYYQILTYNRDTYYESFDYAIYRDGKDDCERAKISFLVCGENCSACEGDSSDTVRCTKCYSGYSFLEGDNKKCVNTSDFLSTYPNYYLDSANILHKCNDNCEECYEGTFFDSVGREHHRCTKCSRDKVIAIDGDLKDNCVESCEDIGMYSKGQSYECVELCDKYNLYLIESTKECVSYCPSHSPLIIRDKMICVDKCPIGYQENNGECVVFIEVIDDNLARLNYSKEEILESFKDLKDLYISTNKTIQGEDYMFQCYPINQPLSRIGSSSTLDISNCSSILNNSDYVVAKFDINRKNSTNQVEYSIYDQDGSIVNISVCQEERATIKYTLDPESFGINISYVLEMSEQGIDIFNPDDPFFNDICYPYTTKSNTDIPLKDRRKDIFQNVSLCDTDCTYKGFDTITYEVTCDCSIKTELTLKPLTPSVPLYTKLLESTNIMIVKCYKLLRDINNYPYNIGFWLFLTYFLFMQTSMLYYYCFAKESFYRLLFSSTKSSPSFIEDKTSSIDSTRRDVIEKESDVIAGLEGKDIDIDKAPFTLAQKEDNRIYPKIVYDNCISKLEFISIAIFPNKFDIVSISISVYILSMALDFTMNSVLFSDDVVSDNYHNEGNMSFLTSMLLSILSNLISAIISFIFVYLSKYALYFEAVDEEKLNDVDYILICSKILHYMKRKLTLYFIISFLFIVVFWYYVTVFCIIYHNNQVNWIIDCITGIVMSLLYTLGIATLVSTIRCIALQTNSANLYNISNYFNK